MFIPPTTDLLKPGTLQDFCDAYAESVSKVEEGLKLIAGAHARMGRIIDHFTIMPDRTSDYSFRETATGPIDECRKNMERSAWQAIVRMTGVTDVMIQRKRDELFKNIEAGQVPPLNFDSVAALLSGLRGDVGKIVNESIMEAARVLRPTSQHYKTNGDGWQLGKRAIIEYGVNFSYGSFDLRYDRDATISVIDNAFHLLDGKGVPANPGRLADAIRAAMSQKLQTCETVYFRCKWFKAGSLHFEFKRADLVDELNKRASDHHSLRRAG